VESPIEGRSTSHVPGERIIDKPELPAQGVATDSEVFTEVVLGSTQLKRGTVEDYEVFCDESPRIGGEGKYPSPMSYMAMGTGF
jgi:hypothetical protein